MINGILLDLSGVLYIDDAPVPGAPEAILRLQNSNIPHCYLTNTTRRTQQTIQQSLNNMGFEIPADNIFTASTAALEYIRSHKLKPHCLVHPNLRSSFDEFNSEQPDAVVLGDAAEDFSYDNLNRAFRVLMQAENTPLISMGYNRYFMEKDGLSLDLGAFTSALEFASGKQAIIMGKPSHDFFLQAVNRLGCPPEQTLMIGDDVYSDVEGAMDAGLQGCLVKTGKYQQGDESRIKRKPDYLASDISDAINWAIAQHS